MMKISDSRNHIIGGLNEHMGDKCPVVLSTSVEPQIDYPYISYTITNPRIEPVKYSMFEEANADKIVRRYETIIEQVYSFTIIGNEEDQVQDLMHKAVNYFRIYGVDNLSIHQIAIVEVSNVQNRDNFVTVDYEKRIGFDVRFRMTEVSEYSANYIEKATINKEEE